MIPFKSVAEVTEWWKAQLKGKSWRNNQVVGVLIDFGAGIGIQRRQIFIDVRYGWVLGFPQ